MSIQLTYEISTCQKNQLAQQYFPTKSLKYRYAKNSMKILLILTLCVNTCDSTILKDLVKSVSFWSGVFTISDPKS